MLIRIEDRLTMGILRVCMDNRVGVYGNTDGGRICGGCGCREYL